MTGSSNCVDKTKLSVDKMLAEIRQLYKKSKGVLRSTESVYAARVADRQDIDRTWLQRHPLQGTCWKHNVSEISFLLYWTDRYIEDTCQSTSRIRGKSFMRQELISQRYLAKIQKALSIEQQTLLSLW